MAEQTYSVPAEAQKILLDDILNNPRLATSLPKDLQDHAARVQFEGNAKPSFPINWRFAESMSALKAFEASMICLLVEKRYGSPPATVTINT